MSHIHEKIDFTAEVFIVHKNKVLLRMHDKYGIWLSVGGHIELDEDPNQAAIREVREETGLVVQLTQLQSKLPYFPSKNHKELIPPRFMNRHKISDQHEHITLIFFATSTSDNFIDTDNSEKSGGLRWVTLSDLKNMDLDEYIRFYAETALSELSFR